MPPLDSRLRTILSRLSRLLRREWGDFRSWLEDTRNFIHLSLLLVVPLLIGLVTWLANSIDLLPFLLFPPLVSGAFALFRDPESQYASPRRFVGGMTMGAICGWVALEVSARYWYNVAPETFQINPGAAAFGVLLTGVVTWGLDLEESQAFSTALLILVSGVTQLVYVVSVFASSLIVVGVFVVWRREIYERRADYLYQTTHADDQVFVPMRGETVETVATFGAQLAAAHETGKLVLFSVVSDVDATAEEAAVDTDGGTELRRVTPTGDAAAGAAGDGRASTDAADLPPAARETAETLEAHAESLRDRFDIPCEVVVVAGEPDDARIAVEAATETNCDLVVTPYQTADGELTRFIRGLFESTLDVVVLRSNGERTSWRRILLPIKNYGEVAHAMLDFAERLAGETSYVSVCHSIDSESERRTAEAMVADLVETFERAIETRVTTSPLETFLSIHADNYDLTILGSSTDRNVVSRIIDAPTFEQLKELDCDIAIVHRG
ncbi:HPP family protein [Halonotius terrestris]|uniref:HPP family protein n=1 Tax=Halonotius terrestris TaxID=2487750 RepID=A0A8J8P7S3_9EURY|nr:HPP family protein [Halonotius terrestris]TQQ81235.1 HPP family protein [Halonotius terrestris]